VCAAKRCGAHPQKKEKNTRWDGRSKKIHPVTGKEIPDESAQVPILSYQNPRKAEWPQADYIIGNP